MKKEIKELKGFNGKYLISSDGKIFRIKKDGTIVDVKQFVTPAGYVIFNVYGSGERKSLYLQREIVRHFGEERGDPWVLTHIDGNKLNNSIENLKWIDKKDMRKKLGQKIEVYNTETGEITIYDSLTKAASANKMSNTKLRDVIDGKYEFKRSSLKNYRFRRL